MGCGVYRWNAVQSSRKLHEHEVSLDFPLLLRTSEHQTLEEPEMNFYPRFANHTETESSSYMVYGESSVKLGISLFLFQTGLSPSRLLHWRYNHPWRFHWYQLPFSMCFVCRKWYRVFVVLYWKEITSDLKRHLVIHFFNLSNIRQTEYQVHQSGLMKG